MSRITENVDVQQHVIITIQSSAYVRKQITVGLAVLSAIISAITWWSGWIKW